MNKVKAAIAVTVPGRDATPGTIRSVCLENDGQPEKIGRILFKHFDESRTRALIELGDIMHLRDSLPPKFPQIISYRDLGYGGLASIMGNNIPARCVPRFFRRIKDFVRYFREENCEYFYVLHNDEEFRTRKVLSWQVNYTNFPYEWYVSRYGKVWTRMNNGVNA